MARKKQKLPIIAGCLAVFLLIGSLLGLAVAIIYFLHRQGSDPLTLPKSFWSTLNASNRERLYLWFALSTVGLPAAIGLFARKSWAYCVYTIINGFNIGLSGVHLILWHDWTVLPVLILNVFVLIYMFLPGVRKVFT